MRHSTLYTIGFAIAVSIVCGVLVSASAVLLKEPQDLNVKLEKQKNVLLAAGLMEPDEKLTADDLAERFANVEAVAIDLKTGERAPDIDTATYDQQKAAKDPATSYEASANMSNIKRLPDYVVVYEIKDADGNVEMLVLPIEGLGLWGTLYGFIAVEKDTTTIRGLTYYQHKETPGLGGEVDNPRWKALWRGRQAYDDEWTPKIEVIKGRAGASEEDPYRVDGLSGATITSRGVTNMLDFWLGDGGLGPFLTKFREDGRTS